MSQSPLAYMDPGFLESNGRAAAFAFSPSISSRSGASRSRRFRTPSSSSDRRASTAASGRSALKTLRARGVHDADEQYEIELTKSRKAVEWARYYEDARELARLLTTWTLTLQSENHRFVVTSGGGRASWRRPTAARARPAARPSA